MRQARVLRLMAPSLATLLALGACGGGGGSGSAMPTPNGVANVQITDGPGDEFQHVWVTITSLAFHTSADQVWSASDATWITKTLPAPVTLDLASLNNGTLNSTLFAGLSLPQGTYRQIRFFFDGAEAPLDASALATVDSNGAALQWNDQVEYLAPGTTQASESPLEIAYPTQGIQLQGSFTVGAGAALNLAVDFDLERMIVPFNHDGQTYFTMRPNLQYFDLSQSAAITGTIDPTHLCPSAAATLAQAPACAFNIVVKAETLAADGSRHVVARETMADPVTGRFTLYPLATKDAGGKAIAAYDVLIRGRNLETMIVTSVPVTSGTSPCRNRSGSTDGRADRRPGAGTQQRGIHGATGHALGAAHQWLCGVRADLAGNRRRALRGALAQHRPVHGHLPQSATAAGGQFAVACG